MEYSIREWTNQAEKKQILSNEPNDHQCGRIAWMAFSGCIKSTRWCLLMWNDGFSIEIQERARIWSYTSIFNCIEYFGFISSMLIYSYRFIQINGKKSVTVWNHDSILNGMTTIWLSSRTECLWTLLINWVNVVRCALLFVCVRVHFNRNGRCKSHSLMCLSLWFTINYEMIWLQTLAQQLHRIHPFA